MPQKARQLTFGRLFFRQSKGIIWSTTDPRISDPKFLIGISFTSRGVPMASSVFDLIEGTVRKYPERTAFLNRQRELVTYARLEEIVEAFSRHAAAEGVKRGHHVAFQADPPEWRLCMQLALSKIGAIWVPALPPGVAKKAGLRIDFVVLGPLTGPSIIDYAILSSSSMLAGPNVIRMNERWLDPKNAPNLGEANGLQSEDDPALIFPSSGTTGVPKPTCFSLSILRSRVDDMLPIVGRPEGRILMLPPPDSYFGFAVSFLTLLSGSQIVWARGADHDLALFLDGQIDEVVAAPAFLATLVDQLKVRRQRLQSVKKIRMGGSIASDSLIKSLQKYVSPNILSVYGSTELGIVASANVDDIKSIPRAVGKLAQGIEARVCDEDGNVLEREQEGLLQFRFTNGRRVVPYIGVPADANTLANDWFSPGDIGSVYANGILCIQGRTADVVNQGGKKISTAVIEDLVVKFLGEPVMVSAVGVALPQGFEQIVIAIDEKFLARIPALSVHLKKLSIFRRGVRVFPLKTFPLNAAGKIDKKELRAAIARGKIKQV